MDRKLWEWKLDVERIRQATAPDWREAARLAAAMAAASGEATLRQAAMQALPILRSASAENAERSTTDAARRRLGVVSDVLHKLATPQFGRRDTPAKLPTPEERYRQLLGLPLGRQLSGAEIHRAWKRAAKTAHPDGGGSAQQFQALCAAQEALMKER